MIQESSSTILNYDHLFYLFIKSMCGTGGVHAVKQGCPPNYSLKIFRILLKITNCLALHLYYKSLNLICMHVSLFFLFLLLTIKVYLLQLMDVTFVWYLFALYQGKMQNMRTSNNILYNLVARSLPCIQPLAWCDIIHQFRFLSALVESWTFCCTVALHMKNL